MLAFGTGRRCDCGIARLQKDRRLEPDILERAEHSVSRREIDPDVVKVLYRLIRAGYVAYLVGGGVRDLMLGRKPKDFDVATSAHPQEVRELFRNSRLIGRRFRLVHVFFGPKNIEVATFRRRSEEMSPEEPLIRHDNTFGTAEEDAFRRDFTVNALFYDPQTFRVIDYTGGVRDLRARLIRTVGDPDIRTAEDPVRMMRAVRFAARLGFEIEPATRAAIERHRSDLQKASIPRLVEETYRTIGQTGAARAMLLMEELGLLEQLMPWLSAHLKTFTGPLESSPTVRNLATLGERIAAGEAPNHEIVLAAMLLDMYLSGAVGCEGEGKIDVVGELRRRGFARSDTENMRLIAEAFPLLREPSRRTRRLARRPYFASARRFFEMVAPAYGVDTSPLARFLENPEVYLAGGTVPAPSRRRRRRRRGGRRHSRRWAARKAGDEPAAAPSGGESTSGAETVAAQGEPRSRSE